MTVPLAGAALAALATLPPVWARPRYTGRKHPSSAPTKHQTPLFLLCNPWRCPIAGALKKVCPDSHRRGLRGCPEQ